MRVNKKSGFTLIELMIAMMLGLIVVGGALSIYISTIRSSSDVVKSARLNYDLDSVMQLMVNDIRRAGYWGGTVAGSDARTNPFTNGTANIQIPSSSCILYTYDYDGDGDLNGNTVVETSEYFGFKLENNAIKVRSSKIADNDCVGDGWESIVDTNKVKITRLEFSLSPIAAEVGPPAIPALPQSSQCLNITTDEVFSGSCSNAFSAAAGVTGKLVAGDEAAETRQVNIILTGEVLTDAAASKLATASVKVRNNRIFTQ